MRTVNLADRPITCPPILLRLKHVHINLLTSERMILDTRYNETVHAAPRRALQNINSEIRP